MQMGLPRLDDKNNLPTDNSHELSSLFSMKIKKYIAVNFAIKLSLAIILKKKKEISSHKESNYEILDRNIPIWTSCHR